MRRAARITVGVGAVLLGFLATTTVAESADDCPPGLVEVQQALSNAFQLSNGGTENHIDPAALGRPQLVPGFEWYPEWSGDRFRGALGAVRADVPASALAAFDEYVDAAAAWLDSDKRWLSVIEIIDASAFDFPEPGYSSAAVGDLLYRYPADSNVESQRDDAWSRYFDAVNSLDLVVMTLPVGAIELDGAILGAGGFPTLTCGVGLGGSDTGGSTGPGTDVDELANSIAAGDVASLSNGELLELIVDPAFAALPGDVMRQVLSALDAGSLTVAELDVLSGTPGNVKRVFEDVVDVYRSGLDKYVPAGSTIPVSARRTLLAVTMLMSMVFTLTPVPGVGLAAGTLAPGIGRRPEEAAQQGSTDIKGPGYRMRTGRGRAAQSLRVLAGIRTPGSADRGDFTHNSVFSYPADGDPTARSFSLPGFVRKFVRETASISFTLAGCVIAVLTLSGASRTNALVATLVAGTIHFVNAMMENDLP